MAESVQCPGCGKSYPLKDELLGRIVQCRSCGQAFRITPIVKAEVINPEQVVPPRPNVAAPPSNAPAPPPNLTAAPNTPAPPPNMAPPSSAAPSAATPRPSVAATPRKVNVAPVKRSSEDSEDIPLAPSSYDTTPARASESVSADPLSRISPWEVAIQKLSFRGPKDVVNLFARHRLMSAVVAVAFFSLIAFSQVERTQYGLVLFVMGLAMAPFGLLPLPALNESRSGLYFALIALAWLTLGLLMRAIGGELLPPLDGVPVVVGLGVYGTLVIGILVGAGLIAVVSLLFRHFGFFRAGAWLYMVGLAGLPLVASFFPQLPEGTLALEKWIQGAVGQSSSGPAAATPVTSVPVSAPANMPVYAPPASPANPPANPPSPPGGRPPVAPPVVQSPTPQGPNQTTAVGPAAGGAIPAPPPPAPAVTDPRDPTFYRQNLADLKGSDATRRREAVERLKRAEPKELRQEITQTLKERLATTQGPEREETLEALDVWGGDDFVPTLLDLLKDKDPGFRKKVLGILARRKDPRAILPMVHLLADGNSGVEEYLPQMGPAAELAILDFLGDLDEAASARACRVLGRIGSERSLPKLTELAKRNSPVVSSPAEEAIRMINGRLQRGGAGMTTSAKPLEAVKPSAPPEAAKPAAIGATLPERAGGNSLDAAIAQLKAGDKSKEAADRLKRMPPDKDRRKEVAEAIVKAIAEATDAEVRVSLLQALAAWYTPETLPVILEGLRDQNVFVRHKTIEVLGTIRDDRVIRELAECLGDESMLAVHALISIGPSVEKTIIEYTKHPNPQVRLQAAKVLGEIGTVQATTALTRLSRMGDPMLRWAADDALRAIRDRRAKRDEAETKDPGGSSAKKAE